MSDIPERLRRINTVEELEAALGELSPEEKARLDEVRSAPVTDEELAEFRRTYPRFTELLMELARKRHPD